MHAHVGTQVLGLTPLVYYPGCLSCNASFMSCPLPLMEVEKRRSVFHKLRGKMQTGEFRVMMIGLQDSSQA